MPLRFTRAGSPSVMLSGGAASPAVETSRPIGAFTFTNHTRNAQNAETNINDRSRCSIIPRLETGTPAVDGPVTYHSTFSNLDGGAFQLFSATFYTVGRHALVLSSISGGHAVLTAPFHDGRPPNGFHIISLSGITAQLIRSVHVVRLLFTASPAQTASRNYS